MNYQSVYVYLGGASNPIARIKLAVKVAQANNALLIGISPKEEAVPLMQTMLAQGDNDVAVLESTRPKALGAGQVVLEKFEAIALRADLKRYEIYHCAPDEVTATFGSCATPGNLLVLGQELGDAASAPENLDFLEYLILNSNSSVLVVPDMWSASLGVENVLIAWDGSAAAYRALQDALPFLCQAKRVILATVETRSTRKISPQHREETAVAFITQHHIGLEVEFLRSDSESGPTLLDLSKTMPSCLVVMGCVAHPHWKGVLLGGTTRIMLGSCTVPIFMHR